MKTRDLVMGSIFGFALVAGGSASAGVAVTETPKPKVMVLGTFHFQGSSTDAINVTMGDLSTPERQKEIEEVVDRLAEFAPTKIMVERVPEREEELNATYRAYVAGEHELTAGETQQIAMRLAKRLGHEKLYAVDHQQDMDLQRVMAAGQAAGQQELLAWFQATMAEVQQKVAAEQGPDDSILDALRFHNSDWAHAGNGLYLQLALMGTSADPAGAEVVGGWYERNLQIYANITRATKDPEDRVLVVFGSGHLAHLASFFDQNPYYEWVSALEVLGEHGSEATP
jgi:hypothetical protein